MDAIFNPDLLDLLYNRINIYSLKSIKIMASRFKTLLIKQISSHCLNETGINATYEVAKQMKNPSLGRIVLNSPLKLENLTKRGKEIIECNIPSLPLLPDVVDKISLKNEGGKKTLIFESNPQKVMKDVLEYDPTELSFQKPLKNIIIEHSSPNVAQPFHYGHFRSMIIGNSLANIKEKLGEKTIRLNFLGDWGDRFGLVKLGLELEGTSEESLKENPLELLFQAYVRGNDEAENYPDKISANSDTDKDLKKKIQEWIVSYLKKSYERIDVKFDEYHWESAYNNTESDAINRLREKGLLVTDEEGRQCAKINDKLIPLIKSDGSTLYLARDLNATFDRKLKFHFDEMHYVVEDKQLDHFQKLIALWSAVEPGVVKNITHVLFAKVQGLTTETSNVDFVRSVFEEAKNTLLKVQEQARKPLPDEESAELVSRSAVIISLLKQKRQVPCEFQWEDAFKFRGDTGIRVQYVHALLHSALKNYEDKIATECDPNCLPEPHVSKLIFLMTKYEEKLLESDLKLDPSILVNYLIKLAHYSNEAYESLKIKKVDEKVAGQRLLLFNCCKRILEDGLGLLGLKALEKL